MQIVVGLGTLRKIEFDNFVDHFGAERRAKILLVPGLSAYFAFDFIPFFVFLGWWLGFNDIGGRGLGTDVCQPSHFFLVASPFLD